MKRFNFRLERVLDLREVEKKDSERELAGKNSELRTAEEELEHIIRSQDEHTLPDGKPMTMAEVSLLSSYQEALREALIAQRLMVLEASKAVEEAREAYLEKAAEQEILETLKDKRKDEYKEEVRREERKTLSEFATQRFQKKVYS